jgi:AhpD family alkylhydroperoxidase
MAEHFYHRESSKKLFKLWRLKPELLEAFQDFDEKVFTEGALSTRVKELIAVAAAHITQCPYCIEAHTKRAKKAGATEKEVAEAIFVAMALRAGGSFAHSAVAMEALEEA